MAQMVLTRIDDRFIHGQVVTKWVHYVGGCDEILICDDSMRQDSFLQMVMEMAAPPGIKVRVLSLDETVAAFQNDYKEDRRRVVILLRDPQAASRLVEGGVPIVELNVGGMGAAPGRRPLYRNVSASDAEIDTLKSIQEKGIKVHFQIVPGEDPGSTLEAAIKGRK